MNLEAVLGDQLALIIDGQVACAGVNILARGCQNLKVSAPVDGHIVLVVGAGQGALRADAIDGSRFYPRPDLNTGGHDGALVGRLGPCSLEGLVEQILEFGPLALEGYGVHVGDVVRDDLDVHLLGGHAGRGGAERLHQRLPFYWARPRRSTARRERSPCASIILAVDS